MSNKLNEFKISILNTNASIILITETWLSNKIPDSFIHLPGYLMFRKDRGTEGGGVCIYVRSEIAGNNVRASICPQFTTSGPVESLWLEIKIHNLKFIVACIYRPKQQTSELHNLELIQVIENAMLLNEPVYVFGDFNYPEINWNTLEVHPHNQCSQGFLDSYTNHRGHQMIHFPTRIRNDQISLLDLLIVNEKRLIFDIKESAPLGKSDHIVITAKTQLQITAKPTHKIYKRQFWKADYNAINESLLQQFGQKSDTASTDTFDNLTDIINEAITRHIPYRPQITNPQKPWLSREVLKEIEIKRKLWHIYRKNNTQENYLKYRSQNNKAKAFTESARKAYEENLLNNTKQFYAYVKRLLNTKHIGFNIIDKNTHIPFETDAEIAECFGHQFQSVFTQLNENDTIPTLPAETYSIFEINTILFTPEKVKNAISSLKLNSSPGSDEIPPVFLSRCAQTLKEPLAEVMNDILNSSSFPEPWKKAVVIPIYKKGNKQFVENYRPISLTSALCKCMEKIIVKELTEFFLEAHIIPAEQHGFLPKKSTFTNLLTRLNQWTQADDNHEPIDVIYLDFEKAFDKIPIEYLIYKLEHYGVRGRLLHLIRGFLNERTFQVRIGSTLSSEHTVCSGVPQGSVLGPLLFIVYLSDLYQGLKTNHSSFADDTNIFCNPLLQYNDLQEDLETIKLWTQKWKMPINESKCTVLHIGRNNPNFNYYFSQQIKITSVTSQRDLGILITSDLKWEQHIIQITKKANTMIYLIQKSFCNLSKEMLLKLYKSYIRPKLEHVQSIWHPFYIKDIEQVERVQRRITKLPQELKSQPYETRLKLLSLTTLQDRRIRGDLIETFKILNSHYACNLDIFHTATTTNLRGHSHKLCKERCNKLLRRNFLTNRVVYLWNSLSNDTINSTTTNQFKNRLDREMEVRRNTFVHYTL